jgi:hypothetical protein
MTPDQLAQLESALCWVAFVAALAFTAVQIAVPTPPAPGQSVARLEKRGI